MRKQLQLLAVRQPLLLIECYYSKEDYNNPTLIRKLMKHRTCKYHPHLYIHRLRNSVNDKRKHSPMHLCKILHHIHYFPKQLSNQQAVVQIRVVFYYFLSNTKIPKLLWLHKPSMSHTALNSWQLSLCCCFSNQQLLVLQPCWEP